MPQWRSLTIWLLASVALVMLYAYLPERQPESAVTSLALPSTPPDIFVQGVRLTRFDETGAVAMTTTANSLAVYNDSGNSLLEAPVITLHQKNGASWQVTSQTATLDKNDNMDFHKDVQVVQLEADIPITLDTEQMRVSEQGKRITSELPITFTQGQQILDGIGLNAQLTDNGANINLLSNVSFFYDPS